MRDYVLMALIFGLLPVCFARPWIGFIVWFWFGLMNPHRLTWDFAYKFPFAMLIGGATLLGILMAKDRKPIAWSQELVLAVTLFAYFTFTTTVAWAPAYAWPQLEKVFKILLMTVLATMFIYGRQRITAMMYTIALSIGFYGVKGGLFVLTTGGGGQVKGPEGSFLEGNTFIGLAMNMVLPLILALGREQKRTWIKRAFYMMFGMTVVAIIFTTSRGAYLGLAATIPLMFLRSRKKWLALCLLVPAMVIGQYVLPERIFQRAELIENYQQDGSANQRLQAWTVAWNLAIDRPLTGAGFEFEYSPDNERWLGYGDRKYDWAINHSSAAHSIYFQMLGQHGFVALLLYLTLLVGSLWRLQKIARQARKTVGMEWLSGYATAIQIALIGYMVAGAFLSSAYFDLAFLYYALVAIFERELKSPASASLPASTASATRTRVAITP